MITTNLFNKWAAACSPERLVSARADFQAMEAHVARFPVQKQPVFIHMLGTPGSGKTTVAQALLHALDTEKGSWAWHDFDRVMDLLSGYHVDHKVLGEKDAFDNWELVARAYGYKLLGDLVQRRAHILFDHGAANVDHPDLLRWVKAQGYSVVMIYPKVDIEVAQARVVECAQQPGGRYTPPHYVAERQSLIEELLLDYHQIVHKIIDVDNNGLVNTLDLKPAAEKILELTPKPVKV